jgi:hypothetical protein
MNYIFPSYFYCKYQAPNAEQLISSLSKYTEEDINNSLFTWGTESSSEKVPIKWEDYYTLLQPSVDIFASHIGSGFNYKMHDPWLNIYNRGQFQEVHSHSGHDFSCVFFVNVGENFSNFYFYDRNEISTSVKLKSLLKHYTSHVINDIKTGDILFFPSHMLHGVSPHNNDIPRKTFATNFDINT